MPSMLSATPQDLLRSKVIEPGMYVGVIKSVVQKPAKTDGSTNTIFTFIIKEVNLTEFLWMLFFRKKLRDLLQN